MLYETAGLAEEILGVNIEELDFAGRRCLVKAKGARTKARRRGQSREDCVLETVYWDAGTARLLPRLLKDRTRGPAFVTHRRAGPGKAVSPATHALAPGWPGCRTGRPAPCATSTPPCAGRYGLGPARVPPFRLTRLGEQGASLLMPMAKSRHKKPENVPRYFKPAPEAISEPTSLLAPGDARL